MLNKHYQLSCMPALQFSLQHKRGLCFIPPEIAREADLGGRAAMAGA